MLRFWWQRRAARQDRGSARRGRLDILALEARDLPSVVHPTYVRIAPAGGVTPFSTTGPTGLTPAQVRHAYGFDQISFANGVTGDGAGQTIAIVDAYDDPTIANDLHQFDLQFGLPDPPTFTKVGQTGGSLPAPNGGWATEIALDVEWAHAIAPAANILLVEANSSSLTNLLAAVDYARNQPGVVAVSMSWGLLEFSSSETSFDSHFTTPNGHAGVAFVGSSGDDGAPPIYPAISPNVISVGGTTFNVDSSGNYLSESAWSGSGGGISRYENKPSYQQGVVTQSTTRRTNPDVAYDANPSTGFPVYDSFNNGTAAPWAQFGGTSAGAPQWAALIAIADQGRALAGMAPLDGRSEVLPKLYSLPAPDFRDITSGSSNGSPRYTAIAGYDLATGLGSPVADKLVADLAGVSVTVVAPSVLSTLRGTPQSVTAGTAFADPFWVGVSDPSGSPMNGVTVTFTAPASGPGGTFPGGLLSVTAVTDVAGVAQAPPFTANGLAGSYAVTATVAGGTNTATFALTNLPASAAVQTVAVNDGGVQRSMVTSVTVTFDHLVTFAGDPTAAFTLMNSGGGFVGLNVNTTAVNGVTVATITFSGPLTESGSLTDGTYTLTVASAQIVDGLTGGDYTAGLFRLFGDANGDGAVTAGDFNLFRAVFGATTTDNTFDFDGDGVITASDFNAFRVRFGATVP